MSNQSPPGVGKGKALEELAYEEYQGSKFNVKWRIIKEEGRVIIEKQTWASGVPAAAVLVHKVEVTVNTLKVVNYWMLPNGEEGGVNGMLTMKISTGGESTLSIIVKMIDDYLQASGGSPAKAASLIFEELTECFRNVIQPAITPMHC